MGMLLITNKMKRDLVVQSLSRVLLFATPWTAAWAGFSVHLIRYNCIDLTVDDIM